MAETKTLTQYRDELQRWKKRFANIKAEGRRFAQLGANSVLMAGGGAAAGVLRAKMPNIPGTELPSDGLIGALLIGAAMADIAGEYSDEVASFGGGMVAPRVATIVETALK